ncbi:MAG: hypothetical protein LBU77_03040, partial [Clostridiales bacterium]|nr:hypothetical protein [Clostridiales bacterium]
MDWNNLGQGNNEEETSRLVEKNELNIGSKNFLVGLLAGVVAFTAVCFAFPTISYAIGSRSFSPDGARVQSKIDEIFNVLDATYVNEYDREATIEGLYTGLVYGIGDPYTVYMGAATFDKFMEDTEGVYAGIGVSVSVDTTDNTIMVVSPFEGYPGAEAGILPGDKIVKVNG